MTMTSIPRLKVQVMHETIICIPAHKGIKQKTYSWACPIGPYTLDIYESLNADLSNNIFVYIHIALNIQ